MQYARAKTVGRAEPERWVVESTIPSVSKFCSWVPNGILPVVRQIKNSQSNLNFLLKSATLRKLLQNQAQSLKNQKKQI